jgi:hypothetical protein
MTDPTLLSPSGAPYPPFTNEWLKAEGFEGFLTVRQVRTLGVRAIPADPGVYVLLWPGVGRPRFRSGSTGGWFKGKDPTVSRSILRERWIAESHLVYIGSATAGSSGTRGLQARIGELLCFGMGVPVAHWGGRLMWQIAGSDRLVIAWKRSRSPGAAEARLLGRFERIHGRLPFANLRH